MSRPPSLIVVGLPRSGSSFLAHVLSTLKDLWVFDDLYVLQKAEAIGLGPMEDDQLRRFVDRLAWETRARIKWEADFDAPDMTLDDVDALEQTMLATFAAAKPLWHEVAEAWVTALAGAADCGQWGYKTPQDFLHIQRLHRVWPDARFVHLMRDPRDIMRSYKNLSVWKGGDGDPRSYHPIPYSLYWRLSQRHIAEAHADPDIDIETVRFDELVSDPDEVALRLADHLSTQPTRSAVVESHNSSHSGGPKRSITDTEIWICERIAGAEIEAAGYELRGVRPRVGDLPELIRITGGFVVFQLTRAAKDPEKRQSIVNVGRSFTPTSLRSRR